jgi:6-pyruvoyltetrahydropterin/6-carboxytetrahydropterin synthase
MKYTTLHLAKQNFKFSSAHFLIFNEKSAEMLHGHNYQVKVDLVCPDSKASQEKGYAIDFHVIKKLIKQQCDKWDEHVILPAKHMDMKYKSSADGKNYDIDFRDRFYSLPKNETIWLPIVNTSVENLSSLFAEEISKKLFKLGVEKIRVTVEETRGQSASSVIEKSRV